MAMAATMQDRIGARVPHEAYETLSRAAAPTGPHVGTK